ncbi:hypothetical protein SAY87_016823 [Trapa incisa]|uniref:Uncharacterized protein n=1 Tax=Trapa incisa TaxID=236973 RepID=A0AAN7L6N4_9MYRT|nr:hypothetical protein SAY87_016823 [Trapa incisa]
MFSASLRSDTGWLARGVNPLPQPQMIGTRTIIGIRLPNGRSGLSNPVYLFTRYLYCLTFTNNRLPIGGHLQCHERHQEGLPAAAVGAGHRGPALDAGLQRKG